MSEEPKQEKSGGIPSQPWRIPPSGACDLYSNIFHLHWSLVDVRIRFGVLLPDPDMPPDTATPRIVEVGAVTMNWDQAKNLRDTLNGILQRYEEKNGPIEPKELP